MLLGSLTRIGTTPAREAACLGPATERFGSARASRTDRGPAGAPQGVTTDPASPETKKAARPEAKREGVYFRNESGQPVVITPEALAAAMCDAEEKPLLVTYNVYNSSARMAAKTV